MNVELSFNVQFVLYAALAGIIGALGMTLVLTFIGRFGWTKVNVIKALGTLLGGTGNRAVTLGMILHLIAGIVFAMFYAAIILIVDPAHPGVVIATGLILGFIHGVIASLIFVAGSSLSNPEGEIRKVQFSGGPAYLLGHLVYGLLVGLVLLFSPLIG